MAKELVLDLAIRYGFQVLGALVIFAAAPSWPAGWAGWSTDDCRRVRWNRRCGG